MSTINNHSFLITNSPQQPRFHSLSNSNKHSPTERYIKKQKHFKTQYQEEYQFLNSISKKYLYFQQQTKQSSPQQQHKKISFPYNPLNLCYFQNKFGSKKDITQRKIHHFNSNRSIRKFLDSKLKTQPSQTKKTDIVKQIFLGKKLSQMKQPSNQDILHSVSKQSTKNSGNEQKCGKINKFPLVLKIKSKKAYFLSRFNNKAAMQEQITRINTIYLKNNIQDELNPFEMKFRSKTEDNINLINMMRQQSRKGSAIKKNKVIFNSLKQDKVDPWEIHNQFMDSSLKFDEKF